MLTRIIKFFKNLFIKSKSKVNIPAKYIISRHKHNLSASDIDYRALKIIDRIQAHGYDAYIVGGGVRDLLTRTKPKDFDIATNASPEQIRRIFRNSRIIGRRFKLVHVYFGHHNVIEVATFRSGASDEKHQSGLIIRDNSYGSLKEDAIRRDFSINALYYDPKTHDIIDYVNGFSDLNNKLIKLIGDPSIRYIEDPVRMLRAIRFSIKLEFNIDDDSRNYIKKLAESIKYIAPARIFDEILKIYHSGYSLKAHNLLVEFKIIDYIFLLFEKNEFVNNFIETVLITTDERINNNLPVTPAFLFAAVLWRPLQNKYEEIKDTEELDDFKAIEKAVKFIIERGFGNILIPKRLLRATKEILYMQYRLEHKYGKKKIKTLYHPRFKSGYDFFLLRVKNNDADTELAKFWYNLVNDTNKDENLGNIPSLKLEK